MIYNEKDLTMTPARNCRRLLVTSLLVNAGLLVSLMMSPNSQRVSKIIHTFQTDTIKIDPMPLTDSAITAELVALGCVLPNVALAQFKLETGHFRSAICRENFNIAGIKTSRSKYVVGKNRDHCVYRCYRDCLKDYVRIQNRYLKNIDGKYAAEGEYIHLLQKVK